MLGCGLSPNTSMHAIEELVDPPYLFGSQSIYTLRDGANQVYQKTYTNHNFKGWVQRYDRVEKVLSPPDLKTGKVVGVQSHVIEASALWEKAHERLVKNPLYFVDRI